MDISKIKENRVHHYSYAKNGTTYTGKGEVKEIVKKANGTRVILEDKARNKTLQLYPSWIVR